MMPCAPTITEMRFGQALSKELIEIISGAEAL
jgi:hypothetical protein